MLTGGGLPLVVRIEMVRVDDLQPEVREDVAIEDDLVETLAKISSSKDSPGLMAFYGDVGFRLRPGAGIVAAIEEF